MGPNLLAHVERRHVWFANDEEPLIGAQHAYIYLLYFLIRAGPPPPLIRAMPESKHFF